MKNRNSGFTLVELMVVVLLVTLVVLLATQIPLFTLSSWRKGTERLRMQRDAHYAMITIQRKLRPADNSGVSLSDTDVDGDYHRLDIGEVAFFVDGNYDLIQNPSGDILITGDEDTQFKVKREGSAIKMKLTLVRGSVETVLETVVLPRN